MKRIPSRLLILALTALPSGLLVAAQTDPGGAGYALEQSPLLFGNGYKQPAAAPGGAQAVAGAATPGQAAGSLAALPPGGQAAAADAASAAPRSAPGRVFGSQLFNGSFRNVGGGGFNPDYQVNVGDRIQVRMWGAFSYDGQATVDPQGNIFVPNVGPIAVAGASNGGLTRVVENQVRRVFKANVGVYTSLDTSQPVKVFVTGFVRQPGLYGGIASESLLTYLDRAGGVDPERGSYVDVVLKRGDQVRKRVNLYDFLLNGRIDAVQLQDGDAILVGPRKHSFAVTGEVYNAYEFEFDRPQIPLEEALALAAPKPGATHVSVVRRSGSAKRSEYFALDEARGVMLQAGDGITVTSDRYAGTIQVRIEGAHSGEHAIVLPYGATMKDVMERLKPNPMSRVDAIQLFRKSVAERQKEMLTLSLAKLEESAYSARSKTSEEANLRTREADLLTRFVEKARSIEPKGQVVLNENTLATTLLEDGDVIRIPERTSLVMVHGEVLFPNAVSWREGNGPEDYIRQVGGYTQSSDTSKVVVIKQSGEALEAQNAPTVAAGDEIVVLPKIDAKNVEVARGISQILYQAAIAARVVIGL